MSTKAIRAALLRLAELDDGSAPGTLKALSEVQAIEKAAKTTVASVRLAATPKGAAAQALWESIVKDAP